MTSSTFQLRHPLSLPCTAAWAVVAFHLAYEVAALSCLIGLYVFALVQLARAATPVRAFLAGWLTVLFVGFLVLESVLKPIRKARGAAAARRESPASLK